MHDRGVQPADSQPRAGDATSTDTAAETRGAPVTNEGEFDAAQEAPAGIDQHGLPAPNPGWMGYYFGGGGGGGRCHFGPMMFGPGMGGMVGGGGPGSAGGPGRGRRGGGRGRGRGRYWSGMQWSGMQPFGDDEDVGSVSGHMEDCHIDEERQGSDDDDSTTSSSSSASSNSSSSSSSDSGSDDEDRSSKRKGGKSKRKHGKRRERKQRRLEEYLAALQRSEEAQATSTDKHEGAADEIGEQEPRSSSKSRCDRDKGPHKHCHGNHKRHHRHHGHHHHGHHFNAMMCPPPPPFMPRFGLPPPPTFFDGPPPPGYFAGPPQCLPDHPSGAAAEAEHVGADLKYAAKLNRHSRKIKKTSNKLRKANMKALKMRMKLDRQLQRIAAEDANLAAACEFGMMPPPWIFGRHFRRHHRYHGGRRRFCNGDAGTGRKQQENPEGNRAASRDGAAAEGVHPSGSPHDAGSQTPMEDVEIGEEALADRGGSIETSKAV